MYSPAPSGMRPKNSSGGTAEVLIIIALVLQLILTLYISVVFFEGASLVFIFIGSGIGFVIGAIVLLLGLFFLYAGFAWSWQRAHAGNYSDARPWTLLLGVLGIPFGFIIVGVLYLVAYVILGTANEEQQRASSMPMAPMGAPPAGPPVYNPPAAAPMAPAAAPSPPGAVPSAAPMTAAPVCPRCGRPGTWIAQYSRFYCYTDQQYL